MAVIITYVDASNTHHETTKISAVAGYIAPFEEWERVADEWAKELERCNLPYFHLSELPSMVGHENARMLEGLFCRIIKQSSLAPVGGAVFDSDWYQSDWGDMTTERLGDPYEQCLDLALGCIGAFSAKHFYGHEVSIVCDADASEERIQPIFNAKRKQFSQFARVDIESGGNKNKPIPLQVADLGVGLLRRSWIDLFNQNADIPWGEMPEGRRGQNSFWSLRGGLLIKHVFDHIQRRNVSRRGPSSGPSEKPPE